METQKNTAKLTIDPLGFVSFFWGGFRVVGDVSTENDLRVDGVIQGNIRTIKKVIIGETGQVIGDIEGAEIVILGEVVGKVIGSKTIIVGSKGLLHGTAITDNLQVAFGAEIDAHIEKYNSLPIDISVELSSNTNQATDSLKLAPDQKEKELNSTLAVLN